MANVTARLRAELLRFDRPAGIGGLVRALGLEPALGRLDGDRVPALFPAGPPAPVEAWTVAERDGLTVLLLVTERPCPVASLSELCRRLGRDATRQYLLLLCPASFETVTLAVAGPEGDAHHLTFERERPLAADLDALAEMVAGAGEGGVALILRYARALDRSRIGARFFRDFRATREAVAHAWTGLAPSAQGERAALSLLFLCRLLFLFFLQRLGGLGGTADFLSRHWQGWRRRGGHATTFFRGILQPLFFGSLNTRPAERTPQARALGDLPYLNGGLFERTATERAITGLDLADADMAAVFDGLFERYRFTALDPAERAPDGEASGIDPAMLGRVFEGLMAPAERSRTGTFFTPPRVVDRIVAAAIDALLEERCGPEARGADGSCAAAAARLRTLRAVRVLDPACGSGAFLLGALARLSAMRTALGDGSAEARSEIIARSLHGVDLQADAALLCAMRLWLALTLPAGAGGIAPLPNLDRRVRQGDALLDPLDLAFPGTISLPPADRAALEREIAAIEPVARRYLESEPGERDELQRELRERERSIAHRWIAGWTASADRERRSLEQRLLQRDLWGEPTSDANAARESLLRLEERARETGSLARALRESGSLPFFSFPIHFPETALTGFDLIVMNPPWVRPQRWPAAVRGVVRSRYAVCREPAWTARHSGSGRAATPQTDLAMLFVERAVALLAPGGALGALLPAKTLRSLFAGPARRMLLRDVRVSRIEDFSLDQRALFEADAFAATLVAVKRRAGAAEPGPRVRVTMHRPRREPLRFDVGAEDLPLIPGDPASPWLLVPPGVRAAMRRMQGAGPALGQVAGWSIRRGLETGSNEVLVVRDVSAALGGLARIRAEGAFRSRRADARVSDYEAIIEDRPLHPLVRGSDIRAWRFEVHRHVILGHDRIGRPLGSCPRLHQYLKRHGSRPRRAKARLAGPGQGPRHRVAWHDLAETLRAVLLPPTVRTPFGDDRPPVALNTIYLLETATESEALALAAFLNSTPIRAFAAAIAERAKDAHFRFFAWTVAQIPAPAVLRTGAAALRIASLSEAAHAAGRISADEQRELDDIVARAFGLSARDRAALDRFDRWLHGRTGR